MTKTYLVDGVDLNDEAQGWILDSATKLPAAASRRTTLVELPSRDGAIPVPGGMGTGTVAVSVSVVAGSAKSLKTRLSVLAALMSQATVLSMVEGGARFDVEVLEVTVGDPDFLGWDSAGTWASVTSVFTVAPYWSRPSLITQTVTVDGENIVLSKFAGATGPLADSVFRFSGPLTGVRVTSRHSTFFEVANLVGSGFYLYVSPAALKSWVTTSAASWRPLTSSRPLDYGPGGVPSFWPTVTGPDLTEMRVTVELTNAATTQMTVRGRAWYL